MKFKILFRRLLACAFDFTSVFFMFGFVNGWNYCLQLSSYCLYGFSPCSLPSPWMVSEIKTVFNWRKFSFNFIYKARMLCRWKEEHFYFVKDVEKLNYPKRWIATMFYNKVQSLGLSGNVGYRTIKKFRYFLLGSIKLTRRRTSILNLLFTEKI